MTRLAVRPRPASFRTRLSTFTAIAVGLAVALAAVGSYLAVSHQLYSDVDSSLQNDLSALASSSNALNPFRAAQLLHLSNGSLLQVNTEEGSLVYPNAPADQTAIPFGPAQAQLAAQGDGFSIRTITAGGERYRVIARTAGIRMSGFAPPVPGVIQIARPLSDIAHTLKTLRLILLLATLGGIGLAIALGYVIARTTMRPVIRLTAAAEHVAATHDLERRIPEAGDDELGRLARSFNAMLSTLAASRRQQAQLISDAGHELRTPLTSLRTNIEVLIRTRGLPDRDRAELLADVQAQLGEMTTLIADVVELARADEGQAEPIEVRLDAVVGRAVERARRRAPNVVFETALTSGSVRANPALLERAILNVLDNAAKWSPAGATVSVELQRGELWVLHVRDHGPGISPADLPYVFDRFYRAESARSMPGSGLGLAIVRDVVISHGGTVGITTPPGGGTLVRIELPTVTEAEPDPSPEATGEARSRAGSNPAGDLPDYLDEQHLVR